MTLRQGDIVMVNIPDPAHPHPAMIVTRTDRIWLATTTHVAGISTVFTEPLPDGWRKLPYRAKPATPHPTTGLWKECVLKCDWRSPVTPNDIVEELGRVPTEILEWAIAWIKSDVERIMRERGRA